MNLRNNKERKEKRVIMRKNKMFRKLSGNNKIQKQNHAIFAIFLII